jgi:hypothetical protein
MHPGAGVNRVTLLRSVVQTKLGPAKVWNRRTCVTRVALVQYLLMLQCSHSSLLAECSPIPLADLR